MILLIDNYDSFAHNLARYLQRLDQEVVVKRNDAVDRSTIRQLGPAAIVLSPGPCTPQEAGCSLDVVRDHVTQIPMLGICLGHQTIAAALGGKIVRANEPMHGRTSTIQHNGSTLFANLPKNFKVCRYHSLTVDPDSLPAELKVSAATDDGTIMAVQHRRYPVCGFQFHPEAILTEHGYGLLSNFLSFAGISHSGDPIRLADNERRHPTAVEASLPTRPLTF